jgi:hypothetical protein
VGHGRCLICFWGINKEEREPPIHTKFDLGREYSTPCEARTCTLKSLSTLSYSRIHVQITSVVVRSSPVQPVMYQNRSSPRTNRLGGCVNPASSFRSLQIGIACFFGGDSLDLSLQWQYQRIPSKTCTAYTFRHACGSEIMALNIDITVTPCQKIE